MFVTWEQGILIEATGSSRSWSKTPEVWSGFFVALKTAAHRLVCDSFNSNHSLCMTSLMNWLPNLKQIRGTIFQQPPLTASRLTRFWAAHLPDAIAASSWVAGTQPCEQTKFDVCNSSVHQFGSRIQRLSVFYDCRVKICRWGPDLQNKLVQGHWSGHRPNVEPAPISQSIPQMFVLSLALSGRANTSGVKTAPPRLNWLW